LKRSELTGKSKLVFSKSSFESVEKLSAKDNTEYFDGQKELVSTGNPTPLIGREPSTRDDAMQMGMNSRMKIISQCYERAGGV
jgi:hypothetical protein